MSVFLEPRGMNANMGNTRSVHKGRGDVQQQGVEDTMALDPRRQYATAQAGAQADIDAGLRSYMLRVYNYMALGVAFTGAVTLFMAANPALMQTLAMGPAKWLVFFGVLGLGWFAPRIMMSRSVGAAHACYWAYAGLWGVMISPMIFYFLRIDGGILDIARAFFITSSMFAGMSIFGYVTKKNLSGFAQFFMMAAIGLIVAMLINAFFVQSTGFSLLTSVIAVLLFAGVTAWETQMIKNMYYEAPGDVVTRMAIFGAFILYGSFITIFIHILNILGIMRSN